MSLEQALIAQAKPHMLAARINSIIKEEAGKGCHFDVFPVPVALEPPYHPLSRIPESLNGNGENNFIPEPIPKAGDIVRLQIWLSSEEKFSWLKSELFLKQLRTVTHRVCFEIIGNREKIQMRFVIHQKDVAIVQTAFRGQFERCELSNNSDDPYTILAPDAWDDILFVDCFPPPPYSHLLTQPDELQITTFYSLVSALMEIEPPAIGFFQTILQPVNPAHNWHRNVQVLLDLEYNMKLISGLQAPQRYLQQAPSGDLHQMVSELETKAHNDKPFYSTAVRLGVVSAGQYGLSHLKALSTFINLFQHGGCPLNYVTENDYRGIVSGAGIREMFALGTTYRPGFMVNSSELTGFVHLPPADILEYRQPPITVLKTLSMRKLQLMEGTPIGKSYYAGEESIMCIPNEPRTRSTHIIGKSGQGKSTLMGRMILDDIDKGMGVAVIDPHGDLVDDLLCVIKEDHIEKTIYFDPGHPDYVPLWNPLTRIPGQGLSRTADNLVAAFKTVVTGWGDRLEHLLRNGLYGLLQLPNSTFLDLSNLLRRKTDESNRLQKEILEIIDNETAYQFWKNDFSNYSNEALGPPMHKLSKLMLADKSALMLSQPENLIDFRQIMDSGKILLVNLSNIGPEEREILGCFILSLLHLTALSRSDISIDKRKQFHIHVDEAHRFITEALEDLIVETRKYKASLTLAHHYLSQFGRKKIDALSSVGSTIAMNIDVTDAKHLVKDLQDLAQYKDLITLDKGEAIARIGTDIVRFRTLGPLKIPENHYKGAILDHSFRYYYKPVHAVRELIRKKGRRDHTISVLTDAVGEMPEEFKYDEFDV